ncbi:olfactory receptor 14I1-like [Apteryx mantelli]|uniref:Olfactory receptor n=1 Tax=Apteryx mantelli TaxID=2696672 RepID=A0A8B7ITS7_9AVES|nr:PREDICTED: olfactory receptor 14I1-like [Apteryx mantelli mantelli]XP_025924296.1 olfactory receptor 14I1-like [Apteryx rowi]
MSNQSTVKEFLLQGFSDTRELQIFHFMVFLVIYLAALVGNFLVIVVIVINNHLHTPMYFFLLNLSILDLSAISVILPKSMANFLLNTTSISYSGCVAQVFLFHVFDAADLALLTIMAYDRYIAICKPLQYRTVMKGTACIQMAASAWLSCVPYSALHTGNVFHLSFCKSNVINQFFCEVPQLLKLSCSDSSFSEVGILMFSFSLVLICFTFISMSYIQIFTVVLRIPVKKKQHKAFSTCIPHLIVVLLFVSTGSFAYLKPVSSSPSTLDLTASVLYSVMPPVINPVIYTIRNNEIKAAMRKLTDQRSLYRNSQSFS